MATVLEYTLFGGLQSVKGWCKMKKLSLYILYTIGRIDEKNRLPLKIDILLVCALATRPSVNLCASGALLHTCRNKIDEVFNVAI